MTEKSLKPEEAFSAAFDGLEEELETAFNSLEEQLAEFEADVNSEETQAAFRELETMLQRMTIGGAEDGKA